MRVTTPAGGLGTIELEELTYAELAQIKEAHGVLAEIGRDKIRVGDEDTDVPGIIIEAFGK